MRLLALRGAIVLAMLPSGAMAQQGADPGLIPHVKVYASLSKQAFKGGETGELRITFSPEEGYHINANPPVEFAIDSGKAVLLKGELTQPVDRSNGYLSTRSPVRQTVYVPGTVAPGIHVMKATVTYYYCSDREGWCVRYRQPVSLSFTLVR
jgi:hypothetical protein